MIGALFSDFLPYLIGLFAVLGGGLVAYFKGRGDAKAKADAKASKAALNTVKEIEDAKAASAAGGGDWHDRLRRDSK